MFGAALTATICRGRSSFLDVSNRVASAQFAAVPRLNPRTIARFVDPLPIPKVLSPSGQRADPAAASKTLPFYRVEMREFESRIHRDLKPTRQWGYNSMTPGPVLETRRGHALMVEWVNSLPKRHMFAVDHGLHGAEPGLPEVRTVVHVHGAKTLPESDGYPERWFAPGKSATSYYPNTQDAALLWYHDHAMGINRLNMFAGLFGLFVIRDEVEEALALPRAEYEIPLVVYDRYLDTDSQLSYPVSKDPRNPWVPEVYGDAILINGTLYPYVDVEPRMYRFRILNCANGRFFSLSLSNGQPFYQLGTDLGLLPEPIRLQSLMLFPAERADLIVDFAGRQGEQIVLRHQSIELCQFRVKRGVSGHSGAIPAKLRPIERTRETAATRSRTLTLSEVDDYAGNSMIMLLNGKRWSDPITETPNLDTVEIWNLVNLTGDAHPIHLHLVRFQILDRRPFDQFTYNENHTLRFTGPAVAPDPGEAGWKDTVRADPGMVTRIIIRFEGYPGRYVWHCHLLEHEDNEMMRPYEVIA